nr:MAG TPA: hypothetical protein [Caudoviricetes sp.]
MCGSNSRGKPMLHATCKSVQVCGKFLNIRR